MQIFSGKPSFRAICKEDDKKILIQWLLEYIEDEKHTNPIFFAN